MKIYNSLTNTNENFLPLNPPRVSMHACSTVASDHPQIGHAIAALRFSVVRRYLSHKGYEVALTESIMGADDKAISRTKLRGLSSELVAEKFLKEYREGLTKMGVALPDMLPPATEHIDIHWGGLDLLSSRHENEKARCRAHDKLSSVRHWMHGGLLSVDGVKMSEPLDNPMSIEDALDKYGKELIIWVVLRHHYRSSVDLNNQLFRDNLNVLRDFYINISPSIIGTTIERPNISDPKVKELLNEFEVEMDNDFNTPGALVLLSRSLGEIVALKKQKKMAASKRLEETVVYLGRLLGLFQSQNLVDLTNIMLRFQQQALRTPEAITVKDIDLFIKDREKARENKDFPKADHVCNLLKLHGIAIIDNAVENRWKFTST